MTQTLRVGPRLAGGLLVGLAAGIAKAAGDPAHAAAVEARQRQNVGNEDLLAEYKRLLARLDAEGALPFGAEAQLAGCERILRGRGYILRAR